MTEPIPTEPSVNAEASILAAPGALYDAAADLAARELASEVANELLTEAVTEAVRDKLTDALTPGYLAEFDPLEAERAGAFEEDALSEQDALESALDLIEADPAAGPREG